MSRNGDIQLSSDVVVQCLAAAVPQRAQHVQHAPRTGRGALASLLWVPAIAMGLVWTAA